MMLESESESESKFLGNTGIGIRIGINCYWNRNWNRNAGFWKTLESESESKSTLVESELESESLVPESFTTLVHVHTVDISQISQQQNQKLNSWIVDIPF